MNCPLDSPTSVSTSAGHKTDTRQRACAGGVASKRRVRPCGTHTSGQPGGVCCRARTTESWRRWTGAPRGRCRTGLFRRVLREPAPWGYARAAGPAFRAVGQDASTGACLAAGPWERRAPVRHGRGRSSRRSPSRAPGRLRTVRQAGGRSGREAVRRISWFRTVVHPSAYRRENRAWRSTLPFRSPSLSGRPRSSWRPVSSSPVSPVSAPSPCHPRSAASAAPVALPRGSAACRRARSWEARSEDRHPGLRQRGRRGEPGNFL